MWGTCTTEDFKEFVMCNKSVISPTSRWREKRIDLKKKIFLNKFRYLEMWQKSGQWYPQVWRWVGRSTPTAPAAADWAHTTAELWWQKETNIPWAATLQTSGAFHASSRLILTMILQGRTSFLTWHSEKERTHLESKSRDRAIRSQVPPPPPTDSIPKEPGDHLPPPRPEPGSLFHPH